MRGKFASLVLSVLISPVAFSADSLPECPDLRGNPIRVDNDRVLHLKKSTKNQYKDRAYISGVLVGVIQDRKSHLHLDVFIGESRAGTGRDSDIEIVHNKEFGSPGAKELRPGMEVTACGDFINAFDRAGNYPPSPVGAIIHWTHMAPRPGHGAGFLAVDGKLHGQINPNDRPFQSFLGQPSEEMFNIFDIAN